jgi:catechol 2,3-dioxygenase-like lactoylglutathione lyase family enzyme
VPDPVARVSHLGVCVADLARARRFWRDALGFRDAGGLAVAGEPAATLLGLPGVRLRAVYLERDGLRVELLHYEAPGALPRGDPPPVPMNRRGPTHLSLRVADLAAACAAIEAAGGRVLGETRIEIAAARTRAVFALCPDGTRLELVEAPGDPAALPGAGAPGAGAG